MFSPWSGQRGRSWWQSVDDLFSGNCRGYTWSERSLSWTAQRLGEAPLKKKKFFDKFVSIYFSSVFAALCLLHTCEGFFFFFFQFILFLNFQNEAAYDDIFQMANFSTFIFRSRVKLETYNVSQTKNRGEKYICVAVTENHTAFPQHKTKVFNVLHTIKKRAGGRPE